MFKSTPYANLRGRASVEYIDETIKKQYEDFNNMD